MPELSQDAIRELRQSLPLLERLKEVFVESPQRITIDEQQQLRQAYNRIADLTSRVDVGTWVGLISDRYDDWPSRGSPICDRLYLYVQGILQTQELEETLNRLTQENVSLKYQLGKAQISATYSVPPREDLLNSLERELATHTKNLYAAREKKAKYGLNPPLDILNEIEHAEKEIERINAQIAYFGSQQR